MFCTKCGIELEERDHFCYRCGAITVRGQSPYAQRRLVRSVTNKKIAGVCGGLAEYLDADPVMMRLLWVLLTLGLPPAGIIGYIVAWIVIPKAPTVPVGFNPAPVPQS